MWAAICKTLRLRCVLQFEEAKLKHCVTSTTGPSLSTCHINPFEATMRTAAPCSTLTGTRRLAPAPLPRPRARQAVRPAAQQRQTTTTEVQHRTDRLLALAEEFIHHWVHGSREGPSETVVRALHTVTNTDVVFKSMKPLGKSEFQGMDGLRDMLTLEAHREGGMKPVRAAITAANDEDDSVFCLMEGEACVRSPMLTPEKREGGETFQHKGYGIVKFDTLLDDTSCCVTALNERWQLAPADMSLLAVHVPFPVGEAPESEDREAAVRKVLDGCGTELFPNDRVKVMDFDREAALTSMELWCRARCTGHDEEHLLKQAFKHGEFRLWDGMGVLPMVCGIKPGKEHGSSPRDCIMTCEATLDLVRNAKVHNEITCAMLDRAVCRTHNVGFVHWRSHIHPHNKEECSSIVEGMDMHVFNEEGKITDIWMLRDPMKAEQEMLSRILAPKKESMRPMT